MCVNSKLGNVPTYITVDVRRWVLTHLPVLPDRHDWTIAGFSEGSTGAVQFGAGHPRLFGSLVDLSGEAAPENGSLTQTISVGFAGSRTRYERATPAALLAEHAPYPHTRALFTAGALDRHFGPVAPVMARRARTAGMQVSLWVIPKAKHNWSVASVALAWAMNALVPGWNLTAPTMSSASSPSRPAIGERDRPPALALRARLAGRRSSARLSARQL
jgi:Putative esterase